MKFNAPILTAILAAGLAPATAQIDSSNFASSPSFTETFAGGTSVGQWQLSTVLTGLSLSGVNAPQFITSTPAGIAPGIVTADPVGSTDGVMVLGNAAADAGSHFGLIYANCINSANDGSGTDFSALVDYKVEAVIWVIGTAEYTGSGNRWQAGPYFHGDSDDLFMGSVWYNVGTTGGGPGVLFRGLTESDANIGTNTTALTNGDWRLFSIMVSGDDVAVGYDANDNGTIDESDPNEFLNGLTRDTGDAAEGPFGIFGVGDVNAENHPLFVDEIRYFEAVTSVNEWSLY